jgi:hypothetical protein
MSTNLRFFDLFRKDTNRITIARILLIGWGVVNIPLGIYTGLGLFLPSNLPPLQFETSFIYENMLSAIYIPLGICAILAAADPLRHKLLIIFIISSSFAHGGIMSYHALTTHLEVWPGLTWGSLTLLATGVAFLVFYPRGIIMNKKEE